MDNFKINIEKYFNDFFTLVSTDKGDWTVKGFIDVYKNIYTISVDTKVVSKIIELMIFPVILRFANENNYEMVLSSHQNHYPDITFIDKKTKEKIALDLKSSYRVNKDTINGMTLGAFTGYFRNRTSSKNVTYPYSEYSRHFVLGIIYSKTDIYNAELKLNGLGIVLTNTQRKKLSSYIATSTDEVFTEFLISISGEFKDKETEIRELIDTCLIDEKVKYTMDNLTTISSVVRDFDFFIQEKWKIAIDRPGSGNTKNIGSTTSINELKNGSGLFTKFTNGNEVFDDFWSFYLTKDMSNKVDLDNPPYSNLKTYLEYKTIKGI